jgi:hypothetical protein
MSLFVCANDEHELSGVFKSKCLLGWKGYTENEIVNMTAIPDSGYLRNSKNSKYKI